MRKYFLALPLMLLGLVFVGTVSAKALMGTATDPNALWLGDVQYLGNPAGYHFWFTPTESHGYYEAGHSYHNVYKLEVEYPEDWCGTTVVPNREPYNLVGHTGETVYYKIIDVTNGGNLCVK